MRTNTFTHDGVEYDLDRVLHETRELPTYPFKLSELKWLIDECEPDPDHAKRYPNMSRPILVVMWEGRICCIDGYHRICNALEMGWEELRGRWVPKHVMDKALIIKDTI